jgi:prophage tail gpP-like protein
VKEIVTLYLGESVWRGWTSVKVTRGLRDAASAFALEIYHKNIDTQAALLLQPDMPIELYTRPEDTDDAADELLMTGYLTEDEYTKNDQGIRLRLQGKSDTHALVKNSVQHPTGIFHNQTVQAIAATLALPYGIITTVEANTGDPIPLFRLEHGEKVFDALERLGRERGLLITDDAGGRLIFCRASQIRTAPIYYGATPVKEWRHRRSSEDRYTNYRVIGQNASNTQQFGATSANCGALAADAGWTERQHTLTILADRLATPATCKARAEFEAAIRSGKSTELIASVWGWRTPLGDLWQPNRVTRVRNEERQIDDDYLISGVEYTIDASGTFAALTLSPPSAFTPELPAKPRFSANWKETWGIV